MQLLESQQYLFTYNPESQNALDREIPQLESQEMRRAFLDWCSKEGLEPSAGVIVYAPDLDNFSLGAIIEAGRAGRSYIERPDVLIGPFIDADKDGFLRQYQGFRTYRRRDNE